MLCVREVGRLARKTPADVQTAFGFAALHLSDGIDGPAAITAAIALRLDASVVTFNAKHFRAVLV